MERTVVSAAAKLGRRMKKLALYVIFVLLGGKKSRLFEIARLLVRLDHVARRIENANHRIM
jgi:hypothetical protein